MPGGRRAGWSAAAPRGAAQHLQSACRMHGPSSASVGAPQGMKSEPKQAATLASCNEICGLRWMGLWICIGKRTDVNKVREVCKIDLRSPRILREWPVKCTTSAEPLWTTEARGNTLIFDTSCVPKMEPFAQTTRASQQRWPRNMCRPACAKNCTFSPRLPSTETWELRRKARASSLCCKRALQDAI